MNSFAPWHSLGVRNVFTKLKSGPNGLVEREAKRREGEFGPNVMFKPTPPPPLWIVVARKIVSPINIIFIVVGAGIFVGGGDQRVARVLLVVGAIQTTIGVVLDERYRYLQTFIRSVVRSLSVVKRLKAPRSRSEPQLRPIEQLVPGDVILVSGGDSVPADGRIVHATDFCVDESGLTGESFPQIKHAHALEASTSLLDRKNMVYSSSVVTRGKAMVAVTATGTTTVMGAIGVTEGSHHAHVPGHFAAETRPVFVSLLCIAIFTSVVGVLWGFRMGWSASLLGSTILAVAIVTTPQWFMAIRTLLASEVARRLIRMGTIIKYPQTAELLGRATVVCLDKTATLTQGALSVESIIDAQGAVYSYKNRSQAPELLWRAVVCANDANAIVSTDKSRRTRWVGDTTDCAFAKSAHECGYEMARLEHDSPRLRSFPFDRQFKWMGSIHRDGRGVAVYVKGAPERVLELCTQRLRNDRKAETLTAAHTMDITKRINQSAAEGLRVVGVAMKRYGGIAGAPNQRDAVRGLIWLGAFFLSDPIREDSRLCINEMHSYGLETIIVTGDHPENARMLTRALGWDSQEPVAGSAITQMTDEAIVDAVFRYRVFSRVEPQQKERIVQALQRKGHVVVMTGDGINDAYALKQADVGIAVANATDIARDAADIIIGSDNLFSIISVLRQGRWVTGLIRIMGLFTVFQSGILAATIIGGAVTGRSMNLWQVIWITVLMSSLPAVLLLFSNGASIIIQYPPDRKWMYVLIAVTGLMAGSVIMLVSQVPQITELSSLHQQGLIWTLSALGPLAFIMIPVSTARVGRQLVLIVILCALAVALQTLALHDPWLQQIFSVAPLSVNGWVTVAVFAIFAVSVRWIITQTQRLYVR